MQEIVDLIKTEGAQAIMTHQDMAEHPVLCSKIRLPTPAIRSAFDVVANTALQRAPGCCFHAYPRFGKTSAIDVLTHQLGQSFPEMPVFSISAIWHPRFSELAYMGELLSGCAHVMSSVSKVESRRMRLLNFLWTQAKARGSDRIMIFIDEAQNWHEPELTMLRDVANDLALHHSIQLIAVLFGAPELVSLRTSLIEAGRIDLIGRFMIQQYEFNGITCLEELLKTMAYYDDAEISEFPEGSGISYSEYLLGQAYRSGWRLQHESARLWEEFKHAAQASGGLGQVGMLWVTDSIRHFFLDQLEYDHPGLAGDTNTWSAAVASSGFKNSLGVTYTT